jgi:hypothetical protein
LGYDGESEAYRRVDSNHHWTRSERAATTNWATSAKNINKKLTFFSSTAKNVTRTGPFLLVPRARLELALNDLSDHCHYQLGYRGEYRWRDSNAH